MSVLDCIRPGVHSAEIPLGAKLVSRAGVLHCVFGVVSVIEAGRARIYSVIPSLLTAFDDLERPHVVIATTGWQAGVIRVGVSMGLKLPRKLVAFLTDWKGFEQW